MNHIEAMKQMVEALEAYQHNGSVQLFDEAITTGRQAIAEAEKQEPVAWFIQYEYRHEFLWREPTAYEKNSALEIKPLYTTPVHATNINKERVHETAFDKHEDWHGQWQWQCGYERGWDAAMGKKENSLTLMQEGKDFTVSKPWVGLTDDEIYDYADKFLYQHGSNYGIKSFGKAIEAKLKEKNT